MVKLIDTSQHWRDCAEGMRTAAAKMQDHDTRRIALGIAEGYELLAKRVEESVATRRKKRPPAGTAFSVEVGGAVHHGTFEVTGSVIIVSSGVWAYSGPLGDHAQRPKVLAKMILTEAVRDKAVPGN